MIPTPEINFQRTPVTLILAALVLALEVVCTLDPARRLQYLVDFRLGMSFEIWQWQWWRPFTCVLLHGNLLHALFNVYWLSVFGPAIENWIGPYKTLALVVLLAYTSSLAEYVVGNWLLDRHHGLVGLSGVMYGLFGLLWVGGWHRTDLRAICNETVVQGMIAWGVFCIVTTYLDWMPVANLAHGAGMALGMLIGMAIFKPRQRVLWTATAALYSGLMLATLIGAPGHLGYEWSRHERRLEKLRREFPDWFRDGDAVFDADGDADAGDLTDDP